MEPIELAEHSYFFVGASYFELDGRTLAQGGMYVEKFAPLEQSQTPSDSGCDDSRRESNRNYFTGTPDGRRGWVHDFYVPDTPSMWSINPNVDVQVIRFR